MKRILNFLLVLVVSVVAVGSTCFADEHVFEDEIVFTDPPSIIMIEGGRLELVDIGDVADPNRSYRYRVVTDGGNLNVRSGPGTNYSIVGQLANGSYVDISFMQDAGIDPWVYGSGISVSTGQRIRGYMHGSYLSYVPDE